jgi:natural product biosynthesis luciferase-like monooxygenase protein
MASISSVFVGNGSLLISCAEVYRQAGHTVASVATANADILAWAESRGIPAVFMDAPSRLAFPGVEFDYLFSIANLEMLPAGLIGQARKLAINFHDALLPRYAGLNATSWALMAREKEHGVTWHEMTPTVDAGRIVRQAAFAVNDEDTALSLNTKCYEAGLASFSAIVADLGRGELALAPQIGERSYFGRHRRPAKLGTLDFGRPALESAALVRALAFGAYANPLARAKIYTGSGTLAVKSAHVLPKSSSATAGTILASQSGSLRVATIDDDLLLDGVTDWQGEPISARSGPFALGARLPAVDDALSARLEASAVRMAKGESFWVRHLATLEPVELPHPRKHAAASAAASAPIAVALDVPVAQEHLVPAFFSWLSALTGQERVSALYHDANLAEQAGGLEAWISPWVPLTLVTSPQAGVAELVESAAVHVAKVHDAGCHAVDLPQRLGDKSASAQRKGRVALCVGPRPPAVKFDLLLLSNEVGSLSLVADGAVFSEETAQAMARQLSFYFAGFGALPQRVTDVALLPTAEWQALQALNATAVPYDDTGCVPAAFSAQVERTPEHAAISFRGSDLSYRELDQKATSMACSLAGRGVRPGDIVGLLLERTPELVISLLAIQKAGAAYLPLDPEYPVERLAYMIEDSATPMVVTRGALAAQFGLTADKTFLIDGPAVAARHEAIELPAVAADSAAYVIYTSGSTGRPKGVVVTHRNVMNFFTGMTARVPNEPPGRWLAVTSLSFDISVLELCWTLTRGFTVVLHSRHADAPSVAGNSTQFSLFYFASDDSSAPKDRYKLLMEGARFADQNGFHAVWTPERHFHAFGGLYPNPAVTSAAIAAITTNVQIRAGSCVLPLHHPIRVAEEWAFVDNISQGRVGISFAAGWQPNDFVIAPQAFANRKADMMSNIDVVRRLWRGDSVEFPGPVGKPVNVQTLPRPIQPELPIWLTAAGNPETFEQAGEMGCRLLTHLLGQSTDELAHKLALYRAAWQRAGHEGQGHVTLMLHTFVGQDEDAVRELVREPMKAYLRSSVDLIKQAAWSFPTFVQRGAANGKSPLEVMNSETLSAEDMDALLEHAFSRYYAGSGLFGTPDRCLLLVDKLRQAGVDEIACLIDFGIETDTVLAHLQDLKQVMQAAQRSRQAPSTDARASLASDLSAQAVTHLQCTPSMASMLVADAAGRHALSGLSALLVGGEALPPDLARQLRDLVPGVLLNMYGPTETTVWSTVCNLDKVGETVPLGQPIANTQLSIRSPWGLECPAGVPGELFIGGAGVTRGYLNRPELTADRFTGDSANLRFYRTGDLVRRRADSTLEFLGRIDNQVKIRGHRIELGEIESALTRQPGVKEAVVVARDMAGGESALAAYITLHAGKTINEASIRDALSRELPDIMVPRKIAELAAFPLTPNGKIDRRNLPDLVTLPAPKAETVAENQIERTISTIWQEVLGLAKVGTSENFFDLGGHSLLVVQVQRRLKEATSREISITDMFRLPTIRALAAHLSMSEARSDQPAAAVSEGQNRANARRVMRSRAGLHSNNQPVAEASHGN